MLTYMYTLTVPPAAIDLHGHVNTVAFVQWMQDAAVAHATAVGALSALNMHEVPWAVRSHPIDYRRQAFLGEIQTLHVPLHAFSEKTGPHDRGAVGECDWLVGRRQLSR